MSRFGITAVRRERDRESGQALVLIGLAMLLLLALAAVVVDIGNLYFSYQELMGATTAAALAGGAAIPSGNVSQVKSAALLYSGQSSADYNYPANMTITSVTPSLACVSPSQYPNMGLPLCALYPSGDNVIQVVETATVKTFFARVFGINGLTIQATATASAKGGGAPPYHIMMVIDSTASMGQGTDTGCISGQTSEKLKPEQCAQEGIQTLLKELNPCPTTESTCGSATNGLYKNPVDQVALMTFPGLCSVQLASGSCPTASSVTTPPSPYATDDYGCPSSSPPITSYNNNPAYLVLPFQTNYRASDTSGLNTSTGSSVSNLVSAVGAVTDGQCDGIQTPGGEGTFYAGAITAAQNYLTANHTAGVQDIMIVLSDGDAESCGVIPTGYTNAGKLPTQQPFNCNQNQMAGSVVMTGQTQTYNIINECQQAVSAATAAKNYIQSDGLATQIYSVSYGSETTGCNYDNSKYGYGTSNLTPCQTMQNIASTPLSTYFFSVPDAATANGTVCANAAQITQLSQVFTAIGGNLSVSRLLPDSVF